MKTLIGLTLVVCLSLPLFGGESPYFQQRSSDLINWLEWSEETRELIRHSEKPVVFTVSHELNPLSRAMGKETFSNADIAKQVNDGFIAVAVDKNQHPVLSAYLSTFVWRTKQIRGWPMTVVTTPDLHPIDGGGYYPPTDGWGSQGFSSVMKSVNDKWVNQREAVLAEARDSLEELDYFMGESSEPSFVYDPELLNVAVENLSIQFDPLHGGFTLPPKSVSFSALSLLDRAISKRPENVGELKAMRELTLKAIIHGGVRDYVGGGFFSASTEESWTIPDFRKSVLVQSEAVMYLSQFPEYKELVNEIAEGMLRDFKTEVELYSETFEVGKVGEEKAVYSWTFEELEALLTEGEMLAFESDFGVRAEGNLSEELDITGDFEGRNVLKLVSDELSASARSGLLKLRRARAAEFKIRREAMSSIETNSIVASALFQAGKHEEGGALVERMIRIYWDDTKRRLHAAALNGQELDSEASSKGYALFIQALLDFGKHDLAGVVQSVMDQRFQSDSGLYFMGRSTGSQSPIRLYDFLENLSRSANSTGLQNMRRMGLDSDIPKRLPEEFSYAPEMYPHLMSVLME